MFLGIDELWNNWSDKNDFLLVFYGMPVVYESRVYVTVDNLAEYEYFSFNVTFDVTSHMWFQMF